MLRLNQLHSAKTTAKESEVSQRPVPYTTSTGLKIGCMYQPKQVWVPSADMERLQTALLRKQRPSYLDECKERFLNLLKGLGV